MYYQFRLDVKVFDAQTLLHAAIARAVKEEVDSAILFDDEQEVDIESCLVMLLDPSALPGCDIVQGDAEHTYAAEPPGGY